MAIAWTKAALALMPRIVDRRSVIKGVPRKFAEQYPDRDKESHRGVPYAQMHDALAALDTEKCERGEVDKIIGNESWTSLECEVCNCDREQLVSIPREYSEAISICAECAHGILAVLEKEA